MAAHRIHPSPAEQVRARLADHKRAGVPFDVAWPRATFRLYVRGGDSAAWHAALADLGVVAEFRAAYEDRPTPLARLAGLSIEELVAAGNRGLAAA